MPNNIGQLSSSRKNNNAIPQTPKSTGKQSRKRKAIMTPLQRAMSSPALMSMTPMNLDDEDGEQRRLQNRSSIVLKEIDTDFGNYSDDVLHPWTKLILLEELGTAWSWFVLLLPYAFMILAVILDGDSQLKNTTVGPLHGNNTCANVVNGSMPSAFDMSVKGYFPVPFRFESVASSGACSYPFELREGVGLLAHGLSSQFNSTVLSSTTSSSLPSGKSSIVDGRYRHLMSHGSAFTSGVISDVPATSQSLQGIAKFNDLSNEAVAMVARGSVLVSAIVFQRQRPPGEIAPAQPVLGQINERSNASISSDVQRWSPVLILNPKQLDMFCTLRRKRHDTSTTSIDPSEPIRWDCTSRHIVDAFFALPNTAVLIGGDLRVDVLLSYREARTSAWINEELAPTAISDDYFSYDSIGEATLSDAQKLLSKADASLGHKALLAEISIKSTYTLEHESSTYENVVEITRIIAFIITVAFLCYWCLSMIAICEDGTNQNDAVNLLQRFKQKLHHMWKETNESYFWWESPWVTFPERYYLQLLILCLMLLQNPLLSYAYFHPSLYSSTKFRCFADSLSGISIQGVLFLWLTLVHGLRYHTAELNRRRFDQYRRVSQLRQATKHIKPPSEVGDDRWAQVKWYYKEYGDFHGGGAEISMALRHKHDTRSDSFLEFIFPKVTLLIIGVISTVTAAVYRFPVSEMTVMTPTTAAYLNPDRFSHDSKVYVISSVVQFIVIEIWCVFIVYTSFVTAERLRREPFLSTRPAQLSFRVLSGILFLGVGFSFTLFSISTMKLLHNTGDSDLSENGIVYDTSLAGTGESWDSRADFLFRILRLATSQSPYVGTASNIGPGKILYATACSLVAAFIFLPSSHFRTSSRENQSTDESSEFPGKSNEMLAIKDRRIQGRDKRFVVALARNSHTWRVFPLPIRSHSLMSQHTLKEQLNMVGTFQLDGSFNMHRFKFGRGTIYKGKYMPVFCIELACWLLEASWQTYYSSTEYSLDEWAPGKLNIDPMGLKVDHFIDDDESDTHAFVASNISEQVEGEEDSIIVIAFRGTASMSNIATDLTFSQVPLHEKVMSDSPAFSIRPGEEVTVADSAWDMDEATPITIVQDILLNRSASYEPPSDQDQATLLPAAVSHGAKAVIRATPMARQALPCVHEGFQQCYMKVRQQLIEAILSVMKRQVDKAVERSRYAGNANEPITLPKIYLTGHSLGGCLSQILALDLASNIEIVIEQSSGTHEISFKQSLSSLDIDEEAQSHNGDFVDARQHQDDLPKKVIRLRPPIAVYTFGQPRVGNVAFKTIYKQRVPHTYRVVTEGDAFTSMPTLGPLCSGIYRHAGLEVLLEEGCTGNILVGPTVVETLLRFTKVRTSVLAHSLERYRESLESALGSDDLREYYRGHGGKVRHNDQEHYLGSNGATLPSWVTQVKRSRRS